jgi:molecular chaperone GrpE
MSTDDPEDSLKEIEAYLSGGVNPVAPKPEVPGFDDMLKSALASATTTAPVVEENDAWLNSLLAETEEESGAALSAMYGAPELAQETQAADRKPKPARPPRLRAVKGVSGSLGAPATQAPKDVEDSLEDAVAAALRSVGMPAVAVRDGGHKDPAAPLKRKGLGGPPTRRIEFPSDSAPVPGSESNGAPAIVPVRSPEAEESAKVKELREQVQQFGRETEKYRERMQEQAKQARTKGRKDVFDRLMPILDTLDIAIQSAPSAKSADKVIAGVEMVFSQLLTELSRLGLECVNPLGDAFDPALHEAMQKSETGTVETGKINKVLRGGFLMDGKLVRAAQVIVEI